MWVTYLILVLAGVLSGSAVHAQSAPALKKGTAYSSVRETMIKHGFRPLDFPKEQQKQRCLGGTQICETYPETNACAGTGRGQCEFVFRGRKGTLVVITTVGEDVANLRYDKSRRARRSEAKDLRQYVH